MSSEAEMERLVRLFERAEREVEAEMLAAFAGDARYTAAQRAAKLADVRRILSGLRVLSERGLATEEAGPARRMVGEAYREGAQQAIRDAKGAGVENLTTSFSQTDTRAVEILYANLAGQLEDGISAVGRRVDDVFRRATLDETLRGLIAGRGRVAVSGAIEERLRREGIRAFRDSAGRSWKLSNYARMAARTARREAASWGTLNRLAENGVDLVTISNPTACPVCRPFLGTFSISGTHPSYPQLAHIPPFHPSCTCDLFGDTRGLL